MTEKRLVVGADQVDAAPASGADGGALEAREGPRWMETLTRRGGDKAAHFHCNTSLCAGALPLPMPRAAIPCPRA